MHEFIQQAEICARAAGDYLLQHFRADPELLSRRGTAKEITTQFDLESDRMIVDMLRDVYPHHNILAEESGLSKGAGGLPDNAESPVIWYVDSLDGSSNFAVGNPFFAVSIAVADENGILGGVVHAPFLQETFVAQRDEGALLNGACLQVSTVSELAGSYLVCCEGGDGSNARVASWNAQLHPIVKDLRKLGSAAIEGAWVAAGRIEAYFSPNLDPWDIAAALLIVEEAGGQATTLQNKKWTPERNSILLSNGLVHEAVLAEIQKTGI